VPKCQMSIKDEVLTVSLFSSSNTAVIQSGVLLIDSISSLLLRHPSEEVVKFIHNLTRLKETAKSPICFL
jgi:archaellum biogenesis ATPase FlaH